MYGTVSWHERTASTLVLVHVWTWMYHYLVYNAPWLHHNCTITTTWVWPCADTHSPTIQTHKNGDGTRLWLILTEYILCLNVVLYDVVCWLWTSRKYVGMHWSMFVFECVIAWCGYNVSQLHTCLLFNYNGNDTLICVDVDSDWIQILHIWNGIVLVLNEQIVRWYRCVFEVECVIVCLRCFMTPSHLHTWLLFNYNDNVTLFCTDADVDWIYETIYICFLPALDKQLVRCYCWIRMYHYFCPRCTMTPSQLHTCLVFNYNDNVTYMTHRSALMLILMEYIYCVYMERYRVGFDQTGRKLVLLVYVWIWLFHYLVNDAHILCIHYETVSCWF